MTKRPARKPFFVVVLLASFVSGLSTYCQEPGKQPLAPAQAISLGPYYALVIGINNYQNLGKLQTPVNDAKALAKLLQEQYGFKETRLLLNGRATRKDIFDALTEYQDRLPVNSNLLVFYAGHGYHDPGTDSAYWLPVDAQLENRDRWISASDITTNIRAMHSKHVLIISDSCYSGALTREANVAIDPRKRDAYLAKMLRPKSRNLMSSGGDEPVADSGAAGHSVFANAVLKSLTEMQEEQFAAGDLFYTFIKRAVAGSSDQVPQYNSIRNSGDESGDFVFSRGRKGVVLVTDADNNNPPSPFQSQFLPEIACKRELTPQSLGPKVKEGDTIDCKHLDQPLKWRMPYSMPELQEAAKTKWTAMLTVTVDEDGWVTDIKPRGRPNPQGTDSALKAAARSWQTNPPTYQGKHVKSSFALDIDFGQ